MIYCKCKLNIRKDISGKRYGRLITICPVGKTKNNSIIYRCLCDCGKYCLVAYRSLTSGATLSCGCFQKEQTSKSNSTHKQSGTKTYKVWLGIKKRCLYKNAVNFERYGGRGISICDRWMTFECFLEDMGHVPIGLQIDRIDNNKGYSLSNCRWVTPAKNCQNTRRNIIISHEGKEMCLSEWSRETGIHARTLSYRVASGMQVEEVLNKATRPKPKSQYKGVTYSKNTTKKWVARKNFNGVRKFLGYFSTETAAYEAYKNAKL